MQIAWTGSLAAPLDEATVAGGRDVGAVSVTRNGEPVVFDTPFAFAFKAFRPDGVIHQP